MLDLTLRSIAASALLLSPVLTAQTTDEVRFALRDYFGPDAKKEPARAKIKGWGEAILPHLRKIANEPGAELLAVSVMSIATSFGTDSAIDLWIDVIAGRTRIDARHGRGQLVLLSRRPGARERLSRSEDVRSALLPLATDESPYSRRDFARAVVELGWEDQLPKLRELVLDPDPGVRRGAARAIKELTGERVAVMQSPDVFRGRKLQEPSPIGDVVAIDLPFSWADPVLEFTRTPNGEPCLLVGREKQFFRYGADKPAWKFETDKVLKRYVHLDRVPAKSGRAARWLGLVADGVHGKPNELQCRLGETTEFEFRPAEASIADLALLSDTEGRYGIALAVGGSVGVQGLDLRGKTCWQLPAPVVYAISTHRDLPRQLLVVGGTCSYVRHARTGKSMRRRVLPLGRDLSWVSQGFLFPSASGKRAALLAGKSSRTENVVGRFDEDGRMVWRVLLGSEIEKMARLDTELLDPDAEEPWFVVTTRAGKLFVIDAGGVLRAETQLPNPKNEDELTTYTLRVGQLDAKRMGIVVRTLKGIWLYPVGVR